ncbi:MAG: sulfatase [Bdellovibrionales bacterium]
MRRALLLLALVSLIGFVLFAGPTPFLFRLTWMEMFNGPQETPPPTFKKCERCNVVLVLLDTLRADRVLGGRGVELAPNLTEIRRSGLTLTHAFTNAFYTTPSLMTIFTSLYPGAHRVLSAHSHIPRLRKLKWEAPPLSKKISTMAEIFRANHYQTIWSAPLGFSQMPSELGFQRGFDLLTDPFLLRSILVNPDHPRLAADALERIRPKTKQPFFWFIHSYMTHLPYLSEQLPKDTGARVRRSELLASFENSWEKARATRKGMPHPPADQKNRKACLDLADFQPCLRLGSDTFAHLAGQFQLNRISRLIDSGRALQPLQERAYDTAVREMDQAVGELWHRLHRSSISENTIFIFVADHGEELFEHGEGSHSSFYEHTSHVPWIMVGPGIPKGIESHQLVSLVDLLPSVLDATDLPANPAAQGTSIFAANPRETVFGSVLGMDYVRTHRWKWLLNSQGLEELYYLPLDPKEKRNIISSPNIIVQRQLRKLRRLTRKWKVGLAL